MSNKDKGAKADVMPGLRARLLSGQKHLEGEATSQLYLAGGVRRRDLAASYHSRSYGAARLGKIRMVQDIKRVSSNLQPYSFDQLECLSKTEIEIAPSGPDQLIPSLVAEGTAGRRSEGGGIEPLHDGAVWHRGAAYLVR